MSTSHYWDPTENAWKPITLAALRGEAGGDGRPDTGTQTSVNSAATDTTILAANTSRIGAAITNDDANDLYLLLGAGTASATNYSVKIPNGGYFEVPFGYAGIIKGIWAADGSGAARVTEFT